MPATSPFSPSLRWVRFTAVAQQALFMPVFGAANLAKTQHIEARFEFLNRRFSSNDRGAAQSDAHKIGIEFPYSSPEDCEMKVAL